MVEAAQPRGFFRRRFPVIPKMLDLIDGFQPQVDGPWAIGRGLCGALFEILASFGFARAARLVIGFDVYGIVIYVSSY